MKAYFVLFILLTSILVFPSSLLARELAARESAGTVAPAAGKPNQIIVAVPPPPCNSKYRHCTFP